MPKHGNDLGSGHHAILKRWYELKNSHYLLSLAFRLHPLYEMKLEQMVNKSNGKWGGGRHTSVDHNVNDHSDDAWVLSSQTAQQRENGWWNERKLKTKMICLYTLQNVQSLDYIFSFCISLYFRIDYTTTTNNLHIFNNSSHHNCKTHKKKS